MSTQPHFRRPGRAEAPSAARSTARWRHRSEPSASKAEVRFGAAAGSLSLIGPDSAPSTSGIEHAHQTAVGGRHVF
jgi:hypothetical protein